MQFCSEGHNEVAYVSSGWDSCPACSYAEEVRKDMQEEIDEMQDKINDLESELDEKE